MRLCGVEPAKEGIQPSHKPWMRNSKETTASCMCFYSKRIMIDELMDNAASYFVPAPVLSQPTYVKALLAQASCQGLLFSIRDS